MGETMDLAAMQQQLDTIQTQLKRINDEEAIPKWWEGQNAIWENRFKNLELKTTESQEYLERIFKLLNKAAEEPEKMNTEKGQQQENQVMNITPPRNEGKQPVQITMVDEQGKYSLKTSELGILSSKPGVNPNVNAGPSHQKMVRSEIVNEQKWGSSKDPYMLEKLNQQNNHGSSWGFNFKPKIELQFFEGENPKGWIRKCQKYFAIFEVPEMQKVELASMYLEGRVETWFDGYIMQKHRVTWHEFTADLCHRFCDKTCEDIIEEFNKLVQKTSVENYQEKFEELKPYMLLQNASLDEGYFVSSFVSGLKEELKHKVKVHRPGTLSEAYRQAKLYELALEFETKKQKYNIRNFNSPVQNMQARNYNVPPPQKPATNTPNTKQSLVEYRRTHNLCFKCGEKFVPGHQCKMKQLNSMEEEEIQGELEELVDETEEKEGNQADGTLEISINALIGSVGCNTLRIQGTIKGRPLNILVDSGSTHSFITSRWAKEGLELVQTHPLAITVANGEKLYSSAKSNFLSWKMQGHQFEHDFRVLQMGEVIWCWG
ncbi:hypothetical protein GQ457_17G002920 [Hibiscus cannabinus]